MAKRIQWLDIVKGVAILGVVLQHTFQRIMTYYNLDDDIVLNFLNKLIVSCNMELFFVVSGIIFFLQRQRYQENPKQFVKTRFIDLIIPYLILGPTIWFGKLMLSSFVKNQVSINDLYDMFITPIAFMWFIYILFFVEVIALFIDRLMKSRFFIPLIGLLLISFTTQFYDFGNPADIYHRVPYYLFWYYLGGILVLFRDLVSCLGRSKVTLVLGLLWIGSYTFGFFVGWGVFSMIRGLFGVAFWLSLYRDKELIGAVNKSLHYLGKRTMYIYILNPLIINGIWQILKKLDMGGHLFVTMLLFIGGVLLIACTIANVAPKIPPIEFIFSPRKYLIKKK